MNRQSKKVTWKIKSSLTPPFLKWFVPYRTSSPGLSPGSDMPRCKHRWSVPLGEVEIIEPSGDSGAEVEVSQEPGKLTITTQQAEERGEKSFQGVFIDVIFLQ